MVHQNHGVEMMQQAHPVYGRNDAG
jgi:hypothetical protein